MKRYLPLILSTLGSIGVVLTGVAVFKATPKAQKILEEKKEEKGEELTFTEAVKATWTVFIPSVAIGFGTIACIFGANALNKHQQASLTSAYALIEHKYKDYARKVKDIYGQEAHDRVMKELAVEKAENISIVSPGFLSNGSVSFEDGEEKTYLFYEPWSERYFESTFSKVLEAEYHLNRNYALGWIPSVNDFYDFLGLSRTKNGDDFGWNPDGEIWIDFNHTKTEIKGQICYIIETIYPPVNDFLE